MEAESERTPATGVAANFNELHMNEQTNIGSFVEGMPEKYRREDERLKTFANWPLAWLDKQEMARIGFVYSGVDDVVRCYFCDVEIGRFEPDDKPVPEHLRWSPSCPLIRRCPTNNAPIDAQALERELPEPSFDVCGINDIIEIHPNAYAESSIPTDEVFESQPTQVASVNEFGYHPHNVAELNMLLEMDRLRTFAEWPRSSKIRPEQLAKAGFFYVGCGDRVRCFCCNLGLKCWEDDDDAFVEHAVHSDHCDFLLLQKGKEFVDNARKHKLQKRTGDSGLRENTMPPTAAIETAAEHANSNSGERRPKKSEELLCKVCYQDDFNAVIVPCGHVACSKCASSVLSCPFCRQSVERVFRMHIP